MISFLVCCFFLRLIYASEECGKASLDPGSNQFAIVGDDSVDVTAPWIAAIGDFRNSSEGFEKFVVACSGVVLSSNMVMTAAHCFDNGVVIHPEFVRVGVTRIDQTRAQDRRIKEVKTHPDRNPPAWYFDLALIILEEKLVFNGRVSSLCLPEKPFAHPGSDPAGPGLGGGHQWDSWPANLRGHSEQSQQPGV